MNNTVWVTYFEVRTAGSTGRFAKQRQTVIAHSSDDAYEQGFRELAAKPGLEIGFPISVEPYHVKCTPLPMAMR